MFYGTTDLATDWPANLTKSWRERLVRAVLFFVPRANPDAEPLYPRVKRWMLEVSDDGWPNREVALDDLGAPLFRLPNARNTGFWTDMAHRQFGRSDLLPVGAEEFERLWNVAEATDVRGA